jgi:flagellar basal-body rod protein FlgF
MDGMIYIASSGAHQMLNAQQVHANNLANVNTIGFKGDLVQLMSAPVAANANTFDTRSFVTANVPATDFKPGSVLATGRNLDVAIQGKGWIAVQAEDGSEAYTRSGMFQINQDGLLSTLNNVPVLGDGGPIVIPPSQKIDIAGDGTISIIPLNSTNNMPAVIGRIKLVNPNVTDLQKGSDGLIRTKNNVAAEADSNVILTSGFLEASNVNAVDSITRMITLAREYEIQLKMMLTAQENDKEGSTVIQLS